MPIALQNTTVQNLMVPGENRWDDEVLNDICNTRDLELNKRILLPLLGRPDSWFWSLDDKGMFRVKSCYRRIQGEHSTSYISFGKKLWSLKFPEKVVNFLWRACSNCHPTTVVLLLKRM